jgi:hypothetical protein
LIIPDEHGVQVWILIQQFAKCALSTFRGPIAFRPMLLADGHTNIAQHILPTGLALPGFPPRQGAGDMSDVPIALLEQVLGGHAPALVIVNRDHGEASLMMHGEDDRYWQADRWSCSHSRLPPTSDTAQMIHPPPGQQRIENRLTSSVSNLGNA